MAPQMPCVPTGWRAVQGALRKSQARCRALEGELADSQRRRPPPPASGGKQHTAATVDSAAQSQLAAQLVEAQQAQREDAAAAAHAEAECSQLRREVQQLRQALQAATEGNSPAADAPAPAAAPADADLLRRVRQQAERLERLEFERDELQVQLEESKDQVAALAAAVAKHQQEQRQQQKEADAAAAAADGGGGSDGGDSGTWRLAAASGSSPIPSVEASAAELEAARRREAALRQQLQQLQGRVNELQAAAAELPADHECSTATAAAATQDMSAGGDDLRRQLEQRSQEVADLTALSLKADATLQQYMVQLRRCCVGGVCMCVCEGGHMRPGGGGAAGACRGGQGIFPCLFFLVVEQAGRPHVPVTSPVLCHWATLPSTAHPTAATPPQHGH